ncbi:MAG: hypothetical protein IPO18_14805 [bacterium]|nr:hypothetical protein [bacterium]
MCGQREREEEVPSVRGSCPHAAGFGITVIAVSTGGTEALSRVIPRLPAGFPLPDFVVQHMPPVFTLSLAAASMQSRR